MKHGHWLVQTKRPRAALRRFEMALQRLEATSDLQSWTPLLAIQWDALIQAGRCACLCAEYSSARWRRLNLPLAIQRLEKALRAAPDHAPLMALLGVANEILQEVS
jgi:Flp pilus assembly protein TadD